MDIEKIIRRNGELKVELMCAKKKNRMLMDVIQSMQTELNQYKENQCDLPAVEHGKNPF